MRGRAVALTAVVLAAGAAVGVLAAPGRLLATLGLGRRVVLYFASPDARYLVPEVRYVPPWRDTPLYRLSLLSTGPRDRARLAPVIPPGARPLSVRVENGVAVADFSRELVERHWGGSAGELMTVFGIVNTLAELPGVQQVQITVEGRTLETLAGHVDLREPLPADRSLVQDAATPPPAQGQQLPSGSPSAPAAGARPRTRGGDLAPTASPG